MKIKYVLAWFNDFSAFRSLYFMVRHDEKCTQVTDEPKDAKKLTLEEAFAQVMVFPVWKRKETFVIPESVFGKTREELETYISDNWHC